MKERIDLFTRILERFKFREPLPEIAQELLRAYRKGSINEALKHFGQYTVMNRLTVNAFYAARAVKLRPSMSQSRVMVGLSAVTCAVAAAAIIAFMLLADTQKPVIVSTVVQVSKAEEKKPASSAEKIEIVNVKRIGVMPLESSFMKERDLDSATNAICKRITALKGKERVVKLTGGKRGYSYLFSGSVEKLGKTIIISADLVDAENGRVIYNKLERIDNTDNINTILKRIAGEAAGKAAF